MKIIYFCNVKILPSDLSRGYPASRAALIFQSSYAQKDETEKSACVTYV